jgi:HD-like signal output (HDOD) protein
MPTAPRDNLNAINTFLNRVPQLHSAPQVAQRVLQLTADPQFEVQEIVECLENDPALTARIMRVVNSSQFGLIGKVESLRQAVAHLGQRSLRLVTMTFSLVDSLTKGIGARLYYDYWRRALTMAAVSARLSECGAGMDRDIAYSAGLLAELGVLVLAQADAEEYAPLYLRTAHGADLIEAEREQYGFAHPALGARLLQLWDFPAALVHAALHHHAQREQPRPLEAAVCGGNLMVDVFWTPHSTQINPARAWVQTHFGLDMDGFIDLALGSKNDVLLNAELFNIRLGPDIDCQALLDQARQQHADASLDAALALDGLLCLIHQEPAERETEQCSPSVLHSEM